MMDWTRIPIALSDESDRRTLSAILVSIGLEVRIVKVQETQRGTPKRYIEYRDTGLAKAQRPQE